MNSFALKEAKSHTHVVGCWRPVGNTVMWRSFGVSALRRGCPV